MKKRILIIDDDEDLSAIISDMLESYGYQVTCAATAEEAFRLLTDKVFHLILLDINLAHTTGFELCQELRRTSTVPVIFASARTSETDRITGFEIGGDDYLLKPYSMKELLVRVNDERPAAFRGVGRVFPCSAVYAGCAYPLAAGKAGR